MVVGQFGSFLYGFINGYEGTIEDGDIFITNDPYSCNGAVSHLNDWLMMMPIFHAGKLVSWAAMFGHMTDVGGKVPGSLPTDAKMIYEEGIIIPPTKIYRNGKLDEEILNIMLHNCRMPEWNTLRLLRHHRGAAPRRAAGARELRPLRRRHLHLRHGRHARAQQAGDGRDHPDDHSRRRPQGQVRGLHRRRRHGQGPLQDRLHALARGRRGAFRLHRHAIRRALLDQLPSQRGNVQDVLRARSPSTCSTRRSCSTTGSTISCTCRSRKACILKPKKPAALSCRTHMLGRIFDLMGGLLGQGAPDALNAAGFSDSPHLMYSGFNSQGRMVPAVPDRLRRRAGPPGRRRAGRALDVAGLHQRAERIPRSLFPAAHP